MSGNLFDNGGGCGLATSNDQPGGVRPRGPKVVFGGEGWFSALIAEQLRLRGFDVCTAATDADLRRIAVRKNPAAVLLPADGITESGYLTCAKLRVGRPDLPVVLIGNATEPGERLAGFLGARYATEDTAADVVMKLV